MLEVADVFRLHGAAYRARYGDRLLPSHARAMQDIAACRTDYFGGHLKQCDHCEQKVYVYHSCRIAIARSVTEARPSASFASSMRACCPAATSC